MSSDKNEKWFVESERIFAILNRVDHIWQKNPDYTFIEMINRLQIDPGISDVELRDYLQQIIDKDEKI